MLNSKFRPNNDVEIHCWTFSWRFSEECFPPCSSQKNPVERNFVRWNRRLEQNLLCTTLHVVLRVIFNLKPSRHHKVTPTADSQRAIFHHWIQYDVFRKLHSPLFSVMNSYCEFIIIKLNSWIQIEYNQLLYLNPYTYEFMYGFRIFKNLNLFKWIHILMNVYIHFIYEFI